MASSKRIRLTGNLDEIIAKGVKFCVIPEDVSLRSAENFTDAVGGKVNGFLRFASKHGYDMGTVHFYSGHLALDIEERVCISNANISQTSRNLLNKMKRKKVRLFLEAV